MKQVTEFGWSCAMVALVVGGCALTSKSEPLQVRYFDPEWRRATITSAKAGDAPCELSLGRVNASADLGEEIAFRTSAYEVGYYETLRWTERPDAYLRRAIERTLFDDYGCRRSVGGGAPTLDLELVAFEEERRTPQVVARVAVRFVLSDEHAVLHEETIDLTRPLAPGNKSDLLDRLVRAIAETLADAVNQVAGRVAVAVRARASK